MSEEDINNSQTLSDEGDVAPSDGLENESESVTSIREVLSQVTGRKFLDDETALKSVKDTFNYVGKAGPGVKLIEKIMSEQGISEQEAIKVAEQAVNPAAAVAAAVDTSKFMSREEYNRDKFFSTNPEYQPYESLITSLQKADPSKTLDEIVSGEVFKPVYEKAKATDEVNKSKSVLHSNLRIGQVTDKLTSAQEALKNGDDKSARSSAVGAVLEAFE